MTATPVKDVLYSDGDGHVLGYFTGNIENGAPEFDNGGALIETNVFEAMSAESQQNYELYFPRN